MKRLVLTPDLTTHHAVIDEQLAALVDLVNEASTCVATPSAMHTFEKVLDQLLEYARFHFEAEEALMASTGYANVQPRAAKLHLSEHRGFQARAATMRAEFVRAPRQVIGQQLVRFLRDWLVHHIGESDHELAAFLSPPSAHPSAPRVASPRLY
jgi:hemerythrin